MAHRKQKVQKRGRVTVRRYKPRGTGLFRRQKVTAVAKANLKLLPKDQGEEAVRRMARGALTIEEEEELFAIDDIDKLFELWMTTGRWLDYCESRAAEVLRRHDITIPQALCELLELLTGMFPSWPGIERVLTG